MNNEKNKPAIQIDFDDDMEFLPLDLSCEDTANIFVKFFECEDKEKALKLLNKLAENKQGEIK
ncbi:hypothetical protein [Methylovorus glucosotrophus]|uniref:Uncharacterized protein n=1 Tax=Methylovorus glucosotrophus (strain SIP3-4) TaxID=582744 RepID=C6X7Y9_METGS|nr:hypothetical protein [Methylovorus glucosotrophus]ACT51316.1 hypothetical protein Msip34_2074 [Methylovorus glucosotrophus SIP3-4]